MSQNFFGKDPMQWWIGQVTDPDKGEWGDSLAKQQVEDGKDVVKFRCRVRIVGYHGSDDDLPDKDLPLAHVLLPSNVSTVGGCTESMQYQGGEVVVGFFADGEDGQQPVIFGTLFKQDYIEDLLPPSEFNKKKYTDFIPYTPPKVIQKYSGKHRVNSNWIPTNPGPRRTGGLGVVLAQAELESDNNSAKTITTTTPCQDNEINKISDAIKEFTEKLQSLQPLNETQTYIDPVYGGLIDIQNEIKLTTTKIHDSMTRLIRRGRSWTIQETLKKLNLTLKDKTPKTLHGPVGGAAKNLTDIIFCNFEKIQDQLVNYLSKSLENMIGQVLDVPICGIENFLGDMFGQINNILDSNLGSMFSQLNNIQGGGISLPSKTFSKAIQFSNILTNVLDCDRIKCPKPTKFSTKGGVSNIIPDDFGNIISKAGLSKLTNLVDGIDNIADGIPALPSAPNCDTSVLKCGPPRVDFVGSSGQGASGSAIVNALGNIIGVAINGPGFGFEEPPLLSFFDSCDNGYGAGGYPIMGNVSVLRYSTEDRDNELIPVTANVGDIVFDNDENALKVNDVGLNVTNSDLPIYLPDPNGDEIGVIDVVITNPGQDYLPNTTETDIDGNVKEVIPDPNANYDGEVSYITQLSDVIVQNVGSGYEQGDTAIVEGGQISDSTIGVDGTTGITKPGQAEVELQIQDGYVIGANVVNGGFGFTDLPDILINSDTGIGARLTPVLKFTKVEDAKQITEITQDAVVTVISCIQK